MASFQQEQQVQEVQQEMSCIDGECNGHHCCGDVGCQENHQGEELTKEMVIERIKELKERKKEIMKRNEECKKAKNVTYHDISGANLALLAVEKEEKELKKDKKKIKKRLRIRR